MFILLVNLVRCEGNAEAPLNRSGGFVGGRSTQVSKVVEAVAPTFASRKTPFRWILVHGAQDWKPNMNILWNDDADNVTIVKQISGPVVVTHLFKRPGLHQVQASFKDGADKWNGYATRNVEVKFPYVGMATLTLDKPEVMPDEPVSFSATPVLARATYLWQFGDETTPRLTNASTMIRQFKRGGLWPVIVGIKDLDGNSYGEAESQIKVVVPCKAAIKHLASVAVKGGVGSVRLDASSSTGSEPLVYGVHWGDGIVTFQTTPSFGHQYQLEGGYQITLMVADGEGRQDMLAPLQVSAASPFFQPDKTPPVTTVQVGSPSRKDEDGHWRVTSATPIFFDARDDGVGLAYTQVRIGQGTWERLPSHKWRIPISISEGPVQVSYQSVDLLNNWETVKVITFTLDHQELNPDLNPEEQKQ